MRTFIKLMLLCLFMLAFLSSGWVSYSQDGECPGENAKMDEGKFLSAHGLSKENFSIWLKEHSVWRKKYTNELKCFSFIPQDNDPNRR